ncbi:hypothetical protein PMAYCL1PPCAC_14502, partial [Pristionchus mayeri]
MMEDQRSSASLRVAGEDVEEVVDLVVVDHRHLGSADCAADCLEHVALARDWIRLTILSPPLPLPPLLLARLLDRQLLLVVHPAVLHEHRPVLVLVDLVSLAVPREQHHAAGAREHRVRAVLQTDLLRVHLSAVVLLALIASSPLLHPFLVVVVLGGIVEVGQRLRRLLLLSRLFRSFARCSSGHLDRIVLFPIIRLLRTAAVLLLFHLFVLLVLLVFLTLVHSFRIGEFDLLLLLSLLRHLHILLLLLLP